MKKHRMLVSCVLVILALYLAEAAAVGGYLRHMVQSSYRGYGEENPFTDSVSDESYQQMCVRNGYSVSSREDPALRETKTLIGPLAYHWFVGGKAIYWYTYQIYDEDGTLAGGSARVPVTVSYTFSDGKLLITDYQEAP